MMEVAPLWSCATSVSRHCLRSASLAVLFAFGFRIVGAWLPVAGWVWLAGLAGWLVGWLGRWVSGRLAGWPAGWLVWLLWEAQFQQ
jgi:hypothetical protein